MGALKDFLFGSAGETGTRANTDSAALNSLKSAQSAQANPALQSLLSQYSSGKMSLQQALAQAAHSGGYDPYASQRQGLMQQRDKLKQALASQGGVGLAMSALGGGGNSDIMKQLQDVEGQLGQLPGASDESMNQQALSNMIATDPMAGSIYAKEQVMQDPTLRGLYNQGGMLDQATSQYGQMAGNLDQDRQALMGRDESYGLTQNDLKAYGQASGNIARMFGGQEQALSQMLADRGLSQAPSGAAGAAYSGLMGNKMEQLAGLQQQIAQNRINTAKDLAQSRTNADLQRQAQTGALATQLGQLGQGAIQNQWNRQMGGAENQFNQQAGLAGLDLNKAGLEQNITNSQISNKANSATQGLVGSAISGGIGAATGGLGAGIGGSLGKSIGGSMFGGTKK